MSWSPRSEGSAPAEAHRVPGASADDLRKQKKCKAATFLLGVGAALPTWQGSLRRLPYPPALAKMEIKAEIKKLLQTPSCPFPGSPSLPGRGLELLPASLGSDGPPALIQSRIHPDEDWERRHCSCSLMLPFWLFPTATPRRSQYPSVTTALGTGEQEKEFGLVSAVLALRCGLDRCLAYANSSCSAGGEKSPPKERGRSAGTRVQWRSGTKSCLQQQHTEGDFARGTLQVARPEHGGRRCDVGARPRTSLAAGVGFAG